MIKKSHIPLFFIAITTILFACNKTKYNSKPKLIYKSANPLRITKSDLILEYIIEDKEGDITNTITLIKTYLNKKKKFPAPYVAKYNMPTNIPQTSNLSATIKVLLGYNTDIGDPQDFRQNDTVLYGAFVEDAANNISDTAYSDTIIILQK